MNRRILTVLLLLITVIQCKPSVDEELPPCIQLSGTTTPRSIQAFIKKDICTACLDLFVAQLHTEKRKIQIDFIIQNPDLFHNWKHRYGNLDRILLMNESLSRCIDTSLAFSAVYHYDEKGKILWTSVLDVERVPWIMEHLPLD